jgi:hypothetical protein
MSGITGFLPCNRKDGKPPDMAVKHPYRINRVEISSLNELVRIRKNEGIVAAISSTYPSHGSISFQVGRGYTGSIPCRAGDKAEQQFIQTILGDGEQGSSRHGSPRSTQEPPPH